MADAFGSSVTVSPSRAGASSPCSHDGRLRVDSKGGATGDGGGGTGGRGGDGDEIGRQWGRGMEPSGFESFMSSDEAAAVVRLFLDHALAPAPRSTPSADLSPQRNPADQTLRESSSSGEAGRRIYPAELELPQSRQVITAIRSDGGSERDMGALGT